MRRKQPGGLLGEELFNHPDQRPRHTVALRRLRDRVCKWTEAKRRRRKVEMWVLIVLSEELTF